jgi:hypothetical protein
MYLGLRGESIKYDERGIIGVGILTNLEGDSLDDIRDC